MIATTSQTGYAPINGLSMYYEVHGTGAPLVLLHGGFGLTEMFGGVLPLLAAHRQVIAVDLQAHGRTADIDRPLRLGHMGADVAALIRYLGLGQADIMGYSMGGGTALQTAIQHPDVVRRLIVVSSPHKRDGWYPESRAGMDQMSAASAQFMQNTPMYESYARVAPDPAHFSELCAKMGELVREPYDWSAEIAALRMPVLLVFGDADSVSPAQAAEFFGLLGGGQRDGSWDRSGMSQSQLAILPGTTHYDIFFSPQLAEVVGRFLDGPPQPSMPEAPHE